MPGTNEPTQVQCFDKAHEVITKGIPANRALVITATMAAHIQCNHMPVGQMGNSLIPATGMKARSMDQ